MENRWDGKKNMIQFSTEFKNVADNISERIKLRIERPIVAADTY